MFGEAPFWKIKSVIIGSSNGLICLSIPLDGYYGDFNDPLYICNPVTREYVFLPICSDENCLKGRNVFGFGYNDKTNEYKVVRIYYESEEHTESGKVQVCTLGACTGWRNKGEIAYSLQTNNSYSPGMNADGEVYWLHQEISEEHCPPGIMMESNEGRIVAFNLADEVFRLLPTPPYYITLDNGQQFVAFLYHQIQVLGGCLCYVHKESHDTINIWSFKKNDDTSSCGLNDKEEDSSNWRLARTVHLQRDHLAQFFDLTESGEILYWDDKKTALSYDPRTASIKELLNDGGPLLSYSHMSLDLINYAWLSAIILKLTRKAVPDVSSCSLQKVEICSQHCLSKRLLCPNLVEEGAKRVDCYPKF
ncbi:F-box protein At3g07870-like [Papaver somniferum]|uniref:F-box protein At3g07870-like n=1 Tax=Papaver somniferum TaxID=3469 RepID=UPI000E705E6C|nr:F-box protein At3g07870-like [Papaver somniferum]